MGVYEGRGTLTKAMKQLQSVWVVTLGDWNDQRSKEFQQRFLDPLELDLRSAVSAMDQVAVLLTKIYSECE